MFTRETYIQNLPRYLAQPLIPCEYWGFDARDGLGEADGSIEVARAETEAFDNSLHFFINVLRFQQAMDYRMGDYVAAPEDETFALYTQEFPYQPLAEGDWSTLLVLHMERMRNPPSLPIYLPERHPFVGAVKIDMGWNSRTVIAEAGGLYIAFFWMTTA
jgi:hypothetical protein